MLDIPRYNGRTDPHEHILAFTTTFKENDLTKDKVESAMVNKFEKTLSGRRGEGHLYDILC